jgi:hypothetical protein
MRQAFLSSYFHAGPKLIYLRLIGREDRQRRPFACPSAKMMQYIDDGIDLDGVVPRGTALLHRRRLTTQRVAYVQEVDHHHRRGRQSARVLKRTIVLYGFHRRIQSL